MNILEELWLGNLNPQGQDAQKDPRIEQALSLVIESEDAIRATLSEEQRERLEKMSDCQSDLTDLLERRAFTKGFRMAAKLMADVINTPEVPSAGG